MEKFLESRIYSENEWSAIDLAVKGQVCIAPSKTGDREQGK